MLLLPDASGPHEHGQRTDRERRVLEVLELFESQRFDHTGVPARGIVEHRRCPPVVIVPRNVEPA